MARGVFTEWWRGAWKEEEERCVSCGMRERVLQSARERVIIEELFCFSRGEKGLRWVCVGVGVGWVLLFLLPLGSVMIMTTIMTNEYISINMFCRLGLVYVCVCW